jgi:hypothetical protein
MRPCFPSFAEVCRSVDEDVDSLANAASDALARGVMGDGLTTAPQSKRKAPHAPRT